MAWKSNRFGGYDNREEHLAISVMDDSSKRWFVTLWKTNRQYNGKEILESHKFIKTKREAHSIAKKIMRDNP